MTIIKGIMQPLKPPGIMLPTNPVLNLLSDFGKNKAAKINTTTHTTTFILISTLSNHKAYSLMMGGASFGFKIEATNKPTPTNILLQY